MDTNNRSRNRSGADTPEAVADFTQHKLGDLIELVIENRLVDFCHVSPEGVVVSMGGHPLTFPAAEARAFLASLAQGWARSEAQLQPATRAVEVRQRLASPTSASPARPSLTIPDSGDGSNSQVSGNVPPKKPAETLPASDEAYVDAVLSCAEKLRLIEGYHKDRASHRIKLKTRATTADMSYFETLEYLTGSILDELRTVPPNIG